VKKVAAKASAKAEETVEDKPKRAAKATKTRAEKGS
jgi:hypothetical protein